MTNQLKDVSKDIVKQARSMSKRNATIVVSVFIVLLVIIACVVFCRKGVGEGGRDELMAVVKGDDEEKTDKKARGDYGSKGESHKKSEKKSDKKTSDKKNKERRKEGREKRKDRDKDKDQKRKKHKRDKSESKSPKKSPKK